MCELKQIKCKGHQQYIQSKNSLDVVKKLKFLNSYKINIHLWLWVLNTNLIPCNHSLFLNFKGESKFNAIYIVYWGLKSKYFTI